MTESLSEALHQPPASERDKGQKLTGRTALMMTVRGPRRLLLMVQPACLALVDLGPAVAQLLDAEALMVRVVAGEVAVCLEPEGVVAAGEEKFLKIAHGDGG